MTVQQQKPKGLIKMKQKEIAEIVGVTEAAVSLWLSGKRRISSEVAKVLGDHLGVDPGVFIFGTLEEIKAALGINNN